MICVHIENCNALAQDWESEFYRAHPLVGKIWDTEKNTWITEKRFYRELLEYDYILLGETHYNVDHHRIQAQILNFLVKNGLKPSIVMEMLRKESWEEQPKKWSQLDELVKQAELKNGSWPWELYLPIFESTVLHQLELAAGNIGSEALHEWSNEIGPYTSEEVITEYWITPESFEQLKTDIVKSHCGHANTAFLQFMARAQLQRDRVLALSLVNQKTPVVLIAGSGHVRNDYAVPMQLFNTHRLLSYLSVAFVTVNPKLREPLEYLGDIPKKFDILYFTPSHTNQDPCEKFRKQLQILQNKN